MTADRHGERRSEDGSPVDAVDAEFAGKHGTMASESSLEEEKRRGLHPQTASEMAEKVEEESEGEGLTGKAKAVLHEADRQIGGEYERRENPDAPGPHGEPPSERERGDADAGAPGARSDPRR
ncbi:MAG TPA: hypothetical protein VJU79_05105 [Candidatus Dormibacteraeota bacterium]|nr:hypothetical protein [Candidatus Dormibacteraeota bacterium]